MLHPIFRPKHSVSLRWGGEKKMTQTWLRFRFQKVSHLFYTLQDQTEQYKPWILDSSLRGWALSRKVRGYRNSKNSRIRRDSVWNIKKKKEICMGSCFLWPCTSKADRYYYYTWSMYTYIWFPSSQSFESLLSFEASAFQNKSCIVFHSWIFLPSFRPPAQTHSSLLWLWLLWAVSFLLLHTVI